MPTAGLRVLFVNVYKLPWVELLFSLNRQKLFGHDAILARKPASDNNHSTFFDDLIGITIAAEYILVKASVDRRRLSF